MAPTHSFPRQGRHIKSLQKFIKMKRLFDVFRMHIAQPHIRHSKARNRMFDREYGLSQMREYSDLEFRRMFRMSRDAFHRLALSIALPLSVDVQKGKNSSGSSISVTTRLACTLRYLAGGSYLDIAVLYGVSIANFFHRDGVLWKTVDAIDATYTIGLSLDAQDLKRTASEFARYSNGHMTKCVMAVDGLVVKTRQPTRREVGDSISTYRNRKCCWGIVCMAGCDAQCRFTMFSAKSSGGTNDIVAWDFSAMKRVIDDGLLPAEYYFIGDEAFSNTNQFLVPWSGTSLGDWKDSYNYHLSSMRQCIERAFGILTKRWGIFWRPLVCSFRRWSTVCLVCAKLHNFCIQHSPDVDSMWHEDIQPGDRWEVIDNNGPDDNELRMRAIGDRRRTITTYFQDIGVRRPLFARRNSRA